MQEKNMKLRANESNKLAKLRARRGLSQSMLSRETGISLRTIQAYESGARDINKMQLITALQFAKTLNCKIDELIK